MRELRLWLVRSRTPLKPQDPPSVALLNSVFLAEPGSRIVQEIICDVFIYAVPAEMDKQHAFDLSEYQQYVRVFTTDKTPVRHVFLMKLVIFCVVVFCRHVSSIMIFRYRKTSRDALCWGLRKFLRPGMGDGKFQYKGCAFTFF